jgi:hypothetical protein
VLTDESGTPVTGNLIVSHNALAVFPIDLSSQIKVIGDQGLDSLMEVQTPSGCFGNDAELESFGGQAQWWVEAKSGMLLLDPTHPLVSNIDAQGPFSPLDTAHVTDITAAMPYSASQDEFIHVPGPMCFGVHVPELGWLWDFEPGSPTLSEAIQMGGISFDLQVSGVDRIGVLVNEVTVFDTISYTVAP